MDEAARDDASDAAFQEAVTQLEAMGGKRHEFKGMVSVTVPRSAILDALKTARAAGLVMLTDIHGMDYLTYPGHTGKRFTVIYNVHDLSGSRRLFLRVDLDDGETLPTATGLWSGASFLERETFDMLGVVFDGHPDLRKLLTPEDLEGHPHRKDFPLGETPTLFNDGRFLDPASFRAGLTGRDTGLTGWKGGAREGVTATQAPAAAPPTATGLPAPKPTPTTRDGNGS
jgi:NADH-quinone oxidoreductase subunit C